MTFLGDKLDQHCSLESLIQKVKLCLNKLKTKLLLDKWKQRIVRRQIELHPEKWKPSACIKDRTSRVITTKLDLGLNLNPIWNSVLMDTPDWAFLEFTSFISFFFFWFVFGMTSALSVCRNCHFGFCTVWDVYAAKEGLLGQNVTFYYSFKCYLQCFNKFLEQWTSVTLTGTLGLVLGPRLGIHELNPHDTNVGSNSFQQQGYK